MGGRTECSNCATGAGYHAERTNIALGERVLDGADEEAGAPEDQSALGGEPDCVAGPEGTRGGCHLCVQCVVCGYGYGCGWSGGRWKVSRQRDIGVELDCTHGVVGCGVLSQDHE